MRPVWPGFQFVVILLPLERIFCYVVNISQEVDIVFGHDMLWTVDIAHMALYMYIYTYVFIYIYLYMYIQYLFIEIDNCI